MGTTLVPAAWYHPRMAIALVAVGLTVILAVVVVVVVFRWQETERALSVDMHRSTFELLERALRDASELNGELLRAFASPPTSPPVVAASSHVASIDDLPVFTDYSDPTDAWIDPGRPMADIVPSGDLNPFGIPALSMEV